MIIIIIIITISSILQHCHTSLYWAFFSEFRTVIGHLFCIFPALFPSSTSLSRRHMSFLRTCPIDLFCTVQLFHQKIFKFNCTQTLGRAATLRADCGSFCAIVARAWVVLVCATIAWWVRKNMKLKNTQGYTIGIEVLWVVCCALTKVGFLLLDGSLMFVQQNFRRHIDLYEEWIQALAFVFNCTQSFCIGSRLVDTGK